MGLRITIHLITVHLRQIIIEIITFKKDKEVETIILIT
jgi:hypothetical protein